MAHGQRQRDVFSGKLVGENTVIGCVVTNAAMNKAQATKLAAVAQNGIARGVRPANATFDGTACLPCAMARSRRTRTQWGFWQPERWKRPLSVA